MNDDQRHDLACELNELGGGNQEATALRIAEQLQSLTAGDKPRQFAVSFEPGETETDGGIVPNFEIAGELVEALHEGRSVSYPACLKVSSKNDVKFDDLGEMVKRGGGHDGVMPSYHDLDEDTIVGYSIITAGDIRKIQELMLK